MVQRKDQIKQEPQIPVKIAERYAQDRDRWKKRVAMWSVRGLDA